MDGEKPATITASPSIPGANVSLYMGLSVRQIGRSPRNNALPLSFEAAAEDQLVHQKVYSDTKCSLPANTRSTFLMVFSPDGKLVASTHGDHCVYVCDVATGACIRTLSGHPRTPWCLAFHPTCSQLLASGCLGGQVRVWDLSGGSEVWCAEEQTVIASLAFHPSSDRLLVIATYNELLFWDWSKAKPFAKCCTRNDKEKVRFVTFDPLGQKLITGIANRWTPPSQWDQQASASVSTFYSRPSTSAAQAGNREFLHRSDLDMQERTSSLASSSNSVSAAAGSSGAATWEWTTPFSNLLQEYESLVQRCRQRFGPERPGPTTGSTGSRPSTSGSSNILSGRPVPGRATNQTGLPTASEAASVSSQGGSTRPFMSATAPNRVDRGTNTQDSNTTESSRTTVPPSLTLSNMRANQRNRINSFMHCIANLEDPVATTNIERLRNPLMSESPPTTTNTTSSSTATATTSETSNLTIPCSVNLGERVSEEGLRRLGEIWRAGIDSASASTSRDNTSRDSTRDSTPGFIRPRRRRRFPNSSFDHKRETKRLRTNCDPQRRESNSTNMPSTASKESKTATKEGTTSSSPLASTSATATTEVPSTVPVEEADGTSRSSIYDNPQPGTSHSGREPEVFIVLSDTDSSSDETNTNSTRGVPLVDLTSPEERHTSAYLSRLELERQIRIIRLLNTPFRRSHPRMPSFLQTSQQSAFRPQTPRGPSSSRGSSSNQSQRTTPTVPRFLRASADLGVRYAIRMLSRHIDMMERRCRARLEILQLEQIRRLWEEFMTQLTSLNSSLSRTNERQVDGNESEPPAASTENAMWTRRGENSDGVDEIINIPVQPESTESSDEAGPSSLPVEIGDTEAVEAIEEAFEQISNDPVLEDEIILLESSLSSVEANASESSSIEAANTPGYSGENSTRASLSGQVPEDRPSDTSTPLPWDRLPTETSSHRSEAAASSSSARSENSTRSNSDTSEEYQSTLLRANQIAVLRRLLTLLDRNEFPFDADAPPRDPNLNSTSTSGNREQARSRETPGRPTRTDRGSPTEFLEELRSIQQSIVQRYDQMSIEIPSQEAMQRDLDRIVNLEAAVRERLRLSEDNFERYRESTGFSAASQPRSLGSPWSREIPLRRRLDPGDPNFVYWNSDLPINRSFLDDYTPAQRSFGSRMNPHPYYFRPPPEPSLMPPMSDERPEPRRDTEPSEEWHHNANLLQSTRRQAWRVLGLMVRHVRQHIELHQLERYSEGSSLQAHLQQLLSLLHRALELTDTLLTQMLATRREMEQQWQVRVRATPPTTTSPSTATTDRTQRQFRHVWHPLERVEYFPSNSSTNFSHTLATWREREATAFGMYAQEMHRRGLYDTDPAVVNHLIQHFQRRTPEPRAPSDATSEKSVTETAVENNNANSHRSQQLRQRLGGLWSCRRNPGDILPPIIREVPSVPNTAREPVPDSERAESSTSGPSTSRNLPSAVPRCHPRVVRLGSIPRTRQTTPRNEDGLFSNNLNNSNSQSSPSQPSLYDNIRSRYNRVCSILDRLTQLDPSPQFRAWADNLRRLLEMPQRYFEAEDERQRSERRQSAFNVPTVRLNDMPLSESSILNQTPRGPSQPTSPPLWTRRTEDEGGPRQRSRSPSPVLGRVRAGAWRSWMYYPRNRGVPNSARDLFGASHQATMEGVRGAAASCPTTLTHRIQCWPFLEGEVPPDISNPQRHVVVASCRINNDASVDVSRDGRLLVALVPSPRPGGHSKLGIYSLETSTLGQMLFSTPLEQSPVSVSLSPSSRFLLVGLATKRFLTARGESSPAAQVFRLPWEKGAGKDRETATILEPSRFIYQTSETGYVSINCIRWAPVSGQGMVYGTNTGNLGILR